MSETDRIVKKVALRAPLERLADELGVRDAVCFRGAVDHAALPQVYQAGSAFVLCSRHEAQGMVAIEAAACGRPIVTTDWPGCPSTRSSRTP